MREVEFHPDGMKSLEVDTTDAYIKAEREAQMEKLNTQVKAREKRLADAGGIKPWPTYNVGGVQGGSLVAVKHDSGKPDYSLLPLDTLEDVVKVLEFGAKKYSRDNWRAGGGHDDNRLLSAVLRHLVEVQKNPNALDDDSGRYHVSHAICGLIFLLNKRPKL